MSKQVVEPEVTMEVKEEGEGEGMREGEMRGNEREDESVTLTVVVVGHSAWWADAGSCGCRK